MADIFLTKMSVKGLGCKPVGSDAPTPLCQILGKASGTKTGENKATAQIWTALSGQFMGLNMVTGEQFRSAKLFLPSGIQDAVEEALKALGDDGGVVNFAMEIRSVKANNPIGYSYQAVNLMPIEGQGDELADLIKTVGPKLKSGSTPKQIEAPETVVVPKKKK